MAVEHVDANTRNWDERAADHVVAYGAQAFADDPAALWAQTEADLLRPFVANGSFAGIDMVHLQCHIGLDTISFARRGASIVGTDLSGEAIEAATALAQRAGSHATFIRCTNEDAPDVLGRQFDVVLTSVGVLMWLEDLDSWAGAVARLLRPGGVFLVYDAHPVLLAMDADREDDQLVVAQPYFASESPKVFDDGATYASATVMDNSVTYEWTHDLGEILSAILRAGLRIEAFAEHRSMPWKALPRMVSTEHGWELPADSAEIPLMFSVVARQSPTAA